MPENKMTPTRRFRLLIIEDDSDRIQLFQSWVPERVLTVVATSAGRALGILERDPGHVYGGILLDHDLEKQTITEAD